MRCCYCLPRSSSKTRLYCLRCNNDHLCRRRAGPHQGETLIMTRLDFHIHHHSEDEDSMVDVDGHKEVEHSEESLALAFQLNSRLKQYFFLHYRPDLDTNEFFDTIKQQPQGMWRSLKDRITYEELHHWMKVNMGELAELHVAHVLIKAYDQSHSWEVTDGSVDREQWAQVLDVSLEGDRKVMVRRTWNTVDHRKAGRLDLVTLSTIFQPHYHQGVETGVKQPKQVMDELRMSIDQDEPGEVVTEKSFIKYCGAFSADFEDSDDFCKTMSLCWGVPYIPVFAFDRLHDKLRDEAERQASELGITASIYLSDLYDRVAEEFSNRSVRSQFRELLKKLNVDPTDEELMAIFAQFDVDNDGKIDNDEFVYTILQQSNHKDGRRKSLAEQQEDIAKAILVHAMPGAKNPGVDSEIREKRRNRRRKKRDRKLERSPRPAPKVPERDLVDFREVKQRDWAYVRSKAERRAAKILVQKAKEKAEMEGKTLQRFASIRATHFDEDSAFRDDD